MIRWRAAALLAVVLIAPARAREPREAVFDAAARTGADTNQVRFHFFCSSNAGPNVTGVLAVELEIQGYEKLRGAFDFDPFEGPDAHAGALTRLRANGAGSKADDRFAAAGSVVPSGASEAFSLEVAASRREPGPLRKLAAVLRPLTAGPGQLVWLQGNATPGGTPIQATLDLTLVQSDQLKARLGPCLDAPGRNAPGLKAR